MEIQLVMQAKKHKKEAFTELMEKHQVSMYKTAIAILQNDEDALQIGQSAVKSRLQAARKILEPYYSQEHGKGGF